MRTYRVSFQGTGFRADEEFDSQTMSIDHGVLMFVDGPVTAAFAVGVWRDVYLVKEDKS